MRAATIARIARPPMTEPATRPGLEREKASAHPVYRATVPKETYLVEREADGPPPAAGSPAETFPSRAAPPETTVEERGLLSLGSALRTKIHLGQKMAYDVERRS